MAIKTFVQLPGRKWVLLGDMFELGEHEAKEHQAIAELCAASNFELVCLVGHAFSQVKINHPSVHLFQNKTEASAFITSQKLENINVLIKGSRGMKMEELNELF